MELLTFILSLISLPLSLVGMFILLNKEFSLDISIIQFQLNLLFVVSSANIVKYLGV